MRSSMCATCAYRDKLPMAVEPEPRHPCHEQLKVICFGSGVNQKVAESGKPLTGDIVRFTYTSGIPDVVPEGKHNWSKTICD